MFLLEEFKGNDKKNTVLTSLLNENKIIFN